MNRITHYLLSGMLVAGCLSAEASPQLPILIGKASRVKDCKIMSVTPALGSPAPKQERLRRGEPNADNEYVIIDEDFSLFTAGSEEVPDTEFIGDPSNPMVDNSLTHQPGWSSNYATQAGGTCALATPPVGGMINTPVGDYSGEVTISFRFKALGEYANMGVLLGAGGIYEPELVDMEMATISEEEVPGEGDLDENGWKQASFTFVNTRTDDCFFQFNSYYSMVLIDDVKVVAKVTDFIAPPTALPATDFSDTGFTAHWSEVVAADHYLFSLYSEKEVSDGQTYVYNFENLPDTEGWTLENCDQTTDDQGFEGSKAPVITQNAVITSPVFGGRVAASSIWLRSIGDEPYSANVTLEGFDGAQWVNVGFIYLDVVATDGEGSRLVINADNRPAIYDRYNTIRYVFEGWDWDAEEGLAPQIVIDNIEVETLPATEKEYAITEEVTTETSKVLTDLDPEKFYFYQVSSVRGDLSATSSPMLALGLGTPVVSPATDITDSSYTANWNRTPKATSYTVRDFDTYTAAQDETDALVFSESFSNAEGGSPEEPISLDNSWEYLPLDQYADNVGWLGASTILTEGMVGCGGSGYSSLITPVLSLGNGDGSFRISITVDLPFGPDGILISPSQAQGEYIGFEGNEGENIIDLNYTGGSNEETIKIQSQYGYPFYVKDLKIYQSLHAGDVVYHLAGIAEVDADVTSHTFENVDFVNTPNHAFDVTAAYAKGLNSCTSLPSQRMEVTKGSNVKLLADADKVAVRTTADGIAIRSSFDTIAEVYNTLGMSVAKCSLSAGVTNISLERGVYVVKVANKTFKVNVK
ncbi:MAG: hypothetical protein ACI304_00425 [Lepagella sp.]